MPMPTPDEVRQLIAGLLERHRYDLEDVQLTRAGKHSVLRVLVSADTGPGLDELGQLSGQISEVLDTVDDPAGLPYTLEVTTPGIDRPLTNARHWRRARGRKVRVRLRASGAQPVTGRIGQLGEGVVELVVPGKAGPAVSEIALADIAEAVVQVEFAPPNVRELELAGVPAGPLPGETPAVSGLAPKPELAAERPDK